MTIALGRTIFARKKEEENRFGNAASVGLPQGKDELAPSIVHRTTIDALLCYRLFIYSICKSPCHERSVRG